jgi:hypothetical protein
MTKSVRLTICALLVASSASAQSAAIVTNEISRLAAAATTQAKQDAVGEVVDNAVKVKLAADGKRANQEFLAFRRADVQNGGGSGATGTTSAVASPLLPAIFGIAFENGALTRTVAGSTVTIKVSPAGLVCASGERALAVAARDPEVCRTFWKRFGLTASFDTSRGEKSATLDNLETARNQFADLTARSELLNRRTPRSYAAFSASAERFVGSLATFAVTTTAWRQKASATLDALTKSPAWDSLSLAQRRERIATELDALVGELPDPPAALRDQWLAALKAEQRSDFNRVVATAEYGFQKPDLAKAAIGTDPVVVPQGVRPPNVHSLRFIYAQGIGDRNLDLTANQSVSWFHDVRPGMRGRLRDLRTGIEAKFRMREILNYGAPTLSFAGLYVFLNQEPLGLGLVAFNGAKIQERGHIRLFQTKLEFPTANNAVRIPISFSASNRTEMLKESDVRGQIGISLNLDVMFAERN